MSDTMTDTPPAHVLEDAGRAWQHKEWGVKEVHDDFDIAPHVTFFREGVRIADFLCARVNKHDAIAVVHLGVAMLEADEVVVSLDSHITDNPVNPKTGKPWAPGEMQNLCNTEGACDTGLITDSILTVRIAPEQPTAMLNRKYHVNHEAREVHWVGDYDCMMEDGKGKHLTGFMIDSFESAWHPDAPKLTIPPPEGLTEDEARAHRQVAGLRLLLMVVGGGAIPLEKVDQPEVMAVFTEYLTEEYVQQDKDSIIGTFVPMLRERFGLDD